MAVVVLRVLRGVGATGAGVAGVADGDGDGLGGASFLLANASANVTISLDRFLNQDDVPSVWRYADDR